MGWEWTDEVARIVSAKEDIISAIEEKGVGVPSGTLIDELGNLIRTISGGTATMLTAYQIVNLIFPVGSVYINYEDISPDERLGVGTWERAEDIASVLSYGDSIYVWRRTG